MCPKCVCLRKSLMVNFLNSSKKKKLHIKYIHTILQQCTSWKSFLFPLMNGVLLLNFYLCFTFWPIVDGLFNFLNCKNAQFFILQRLLYATNQRKDITKITFSSSSSSSSSSSWMQGQQRGAGDLFFFCRKTTFYMRILALWDGQNIKLHFALQINY